MIVVTKGGGKAQKKTDASESQDKDDGSGNVKPSSNQAPSEEGKNKGKDDNAMDDGNSEGSSDQGDLTDQEEESDGEDTASDSDGRRDDAVRDIVVKKPMRADGSGSGGSLRTVLAKGGGRSSRGRGPSSSVWQVWRSTGQTGRHYYCLFWVAGAEERPLSCTAMARNRYTLRCCFTLCCTLVSRVLGS